MYISRVQCPHCGKDVKVISFGYGRVAACCGKIIYRDNEMPGGSVSRKEPDGQRHDRLQSE